MNQTKEMIVRDVNQIDKTRSGLDVGMLTPEGVQEIENQVALIRRVREAVLKLSEPSHWIDMGGKPYLIDDGVHAIGSALRVEYGEPVIKEERGSDEDGQFIHFVCDLSGMWRGSRHSDIGTSSTRDDFFSVRKGQRVPFKDINIGNVRKKSVTNAQHRILEKLTGIGGTTWEMLERAGIRRGAGGTTRFKGQEQKMTTGAGVWTAEKQEIWGRLLEIAGGDESAAAAKLQALSQNKQNGFPGYTDPQKLSDKAATYLLKIVREEFNRNFNAPKEEPGQGSPPREPGQEG